MSSNDEDLRICPFRYCRAALVMSVERASPTDATLRKSIPLHNIEHHLLSGPCPASLQPVGWTRDEALSTPVLTMLADQEAVAAKKIPDLVRQEVEREYNEIAHPGKPGQSQSLRGIHRIGREPIEEADQGDWQLGGREDEDSGKAMLITGAPAVPVYVQGERYGHHMSVADNVTLLTNAKIRSGNAMVQSQEAITNLQGAVEDLGEAVNDVVQVLGTSAAESLQTIYRLLTQASSEIQNAIHAASQAPGSLGTANELMEQRIAAFLA